MNNDDIKHLNTALKGEHMAIEGFDHYIIDASDASLKNELQSIQKIHQAHAIKLSERIQELGGNPVNSAGMAGVFAEVKMKISPQKYINNNLLKSAIEGESIGAQAYNEIISNLSEESNKQLAQEFLQESQNIIKDLNKQLQKFPLKP